MDLNALRTEIDALDDQLLALFLRRMEIVKQVAAYKLENNLPVLHPKREEEILQRMAATAGDHMGGYTQAFFAGLMAVSRQMQEALIAENKR